MMEQIRTPEKTSYYSALAANVWTEICAPNSCDTVIVQHVLNATYGTGAIAVVVDEEEPITALNATDNMFLVEGGDSVAIKNSGRGVWAQSLLGGRIVACLEYQRYVLPSEPITLALEASTTEIDFTVSQPKQLASNVGAPTYSTRFSQANTRNGAAPGPSGVFTEQDSNAISVTGLNANRETKIEVKATNGIGDSALNLLITTRTLPTAEKVKGAVHLSNESMDGVICGNTKPANVAYDFANVTCKKCLKKWEKRNK